MPGAKCSGWEGGPSALHRQLQSGGAGFFIEVAAIAFNGLIGMIGTLRRTGAVGVANQQKASNQSSEVHLQTFARAVSRKVPKRVQASSRKRWSAIIPR